MESYENIDAGETFVLGALRQRGIHACTKMEGARGYIYHVDPLMLVLNAQHASQCFRLESDGKCLHLIQKLKYTKFAELYYPHFTTFCDQSL